MRPIVRTLRTFFFLLSWLTAGTVNANPNGGTVVAGTVDPLPTSGVNFDIGIHSQRAIIDWQSFSIQLGETTRFNFDSASGAVLNRVTTIDPANLSVIAGRLESNGQVILLNPNGILVTPSGVIDTRSFIGTTLALDPAAFMGGGGRFTFEGSADGSIINQGIVLAREQEGLPGGDVVLIAQTVRNDGTISAPQGLAGLAAGTKVTLYDTGDQRLVVEASAPDAEVVNGPDGVIAAVTAELKAAGGNIGALAINNEGVIRADTIVESGGRVFLRASRGTVVNSGTIEAAGTAPGTSGGRVEITGDQVLLASGSSINANGPAGGGTVLVGGDYQGANPDVPNALRTVIAPDAIVTANATSAGDGGRVIVWADEVTRFYGYIEALGGSLAGNGGFVETSGKDHLEAVGLVNASAPNGTGGIWLLDPRNVTIDNVATAGGAFAGNPNVFTPTADNAIADRNTIQTSLNAGTSVQITTGSDGVQDGDITVAASITKSAGGNATLTLSAADDIFVNADIVATAGQLGITLTADADASGAGAITVNNALTANGGAVSLAAATGITLAGANADIATGGGIATFNADSDGNNTGSFTIDNAGGSVASAGGLVTVTAADVALTGTINSGAGGITLQPATDARTIGIAGGAGDFSVSQGELNLLTSTGPLTIGRTTGTHATTVNAVTLVADTVLFGGTPTLAGTITGGGNDLTLNFSGATTIDGAVVTGVGALASGNGGTTTLQGNLTTADGQTYADAVTLGAATTLASSGNGAIALNGTVNGAQTLAINTGGATTFGGVVGGATALTSVTTDAAGTTAVNGGAITTTGDQLFQDDVTLGAATVLASTAAGNVTLGGTVNGAQTLNVNTAGTTAFDGVVGGVTPLTSLTTDAGGTTALNGGAITTSGVQTYNDDVALGANTTLAGTVPTFGGTVVGNNNDLVLNFSGATIIDGAVITDVNDLASGGGGTTTLLGALTTSGNQTYSDAVTLGAATTLASSGNGAIALNGTVNGAQTLAVNTGGATTLGAAVGGTTALTSFTTDAGGTTTLNGGGVTTTAGQTYNDNVTLGAATTLASTANGAIALNGTVNGAQTLAVNTGGATTLGGAVGGTTALTSFATDAGGTTALNGGGVTTTAGQTYNDNVTLGAATTLASTANGAIALNGTVNGAQTLAVNTGGATTFGGAVGGATALTSVTTSAGGTTALNGGVVTTTGAQTYNDNVTLGAAATLASSGAGDVTFGGTVNGAQTLAINTAGILAFDGVVGGGTALTSLTTDAGGTTALNGGGVTTSGAQTYNDNVVLGDDAVLTGGNPTFGGTITGGANDLTLNFSGPTTINGANVTGVANLATGNGGTTTLQGTITTTGDQTYNDDIVTPAGTTTLAAQGVTFDGRVSPGGDAGVGVISINGDLLFDNNATYFVNLNGTAAGQFDQIQATGGAVAFAATSQLDGTTGFAFVLGDLLPIITKDPGAVIGDFADGVAITLNGQQFAIDYGGGGDSFAVQLERDVTTWTWDGNGPNDFWSTPQNWAGLNPADTFAPATGDNLAFAGNNVVNENDVPGLVLSQLVFNANAGAFTLEGLGVTLLGGVLNNSGNLQTIDLPVTLGANATINALNDAVSFGALGTINGPFSLALTGANPVTFGAAVGGTTPLTAVTASTPVALNGGTVTTTGAQTYNDDVTLGAATTLTGSVPTFGGTVDGNNNDLTLNFSGATIIDGAVITDVNNLASAGGGTTTLQGAITTTGTQTYSDDVVLGGAATLAGTTATLGGTFDGNNQDLTLNLSGATTIDGAVIVNVNDLASGGGGTTTLQGTIATTGNQTYNDDVVLAGNVTATSSGNGNIAFNGAVDADDALVNDRTLAVNAGTGNATFAGDVGATQALADLDVTAATINLDAAALTVDDQGGNTIGFNGAVDLGADVTINAGGATGNNVTFAGTVDGAQSLAVNSGGTVAFDGAIGGTTPLDSLTTDAGGLTALNGGAVTTSGAQTYNDAVNLGANTVLAGTTPTFGATLTGNGNDLTLSFSGATLIDGAVITGVSDLISDGGGATSLQGVIATTGTQTYDDNVTLAAATTVVSSGAGAAGDVSFNGTVGGAQDLAVNTAGTTTFDGAVNIGNLTTDDAAGADTTVLGANVTTTGTQTYGDEVVLATDVTLAGTGAAFGSVLTGNNNDLTLNFSGATVIDGAVIAGVADLASGGGGTTTLQGTITTSGSQTYDDDVTLGAATTLVSSGNAGIALNGAVDGAQTLAINTGGTTTFGGAVGGATALTSITTDLAGTTELNGGAVTTSGNQTYNDNVNLGAATTLASTGAGDVTFAGTVNGAQTLAVNTAGTTAFDGVIGGGTALTSLTTDAGGTTALNGGAVTTTGGQVYNDAVVLGANTALAGTTPTFGGTLNGNGNDLTLTFSGATLIDGAVVSGVNDLVSNGGGTTTLQGNLTTTGTQTYDDAVTLGGATTVASTGAGAAGDIDFNGTVNGAQTLAVNTAGTTTFAAAIGNGTALTSLTTDAPGSLALDAGTITTTGGQTYGDATVLGAATTATSTGGGNINFNGTLNGAEVLTVNTAGTTGFGAAVGGIDPLVSITTDLPGTVLLTGGSIITSGAQIYLDPVNLGADTAFSASTLTFGGGLNPNGFAVGTVTVGDQIFANPYVLSADTFLVSTAGRIEFLSTVNSDGTPRSLTLNTPGDTIFGGAVGAVSPLQNLTTDAAGQTLINGGQVNVLGTVTFNDPVVLGADTTVSGLLVTFANTVNAAAAGIQSLGVNASGITTFGGSVGGVSALSSLLTDDAAGTDSTFLSGAVTTTGAQSYGDDVTASGALVGVGIAFGGNAVFDGGGNQSVSAGTGALTVVGNMTKVSAGNLSLSGDLGVTVGGDLEASSGGLIVADHLIAGGVSALQFVDLVSVNSAAGVSAALGGVVAAGAVTTVGNVSGWAVDIGGDAIIGGNVSAGTSVNLGGAADIAGDVTSGTVVQIGAPRDIAFGGPANVAGNINGVGVTFNGTAALDGGADQTVNAGTGTLTANSTLIKTGTGSLILAGDGGVNVTGNLAVSPAGGSLTVQDNLVAGAAVNAGQNVTLNGASSTVTGDVNALGGNLTAGALDAANVNAGGSVTVASIDAGNLIAGGAVTVANNATLTGALSAGGATSVGGAADVNGNVSAGGLFTVGGAASLGGNVTGVGITFNNTATLDGAAAQTVDAGTGALNAGASVTKTGAGNLALGGDAGVNITGNLAVNTAGGSLAVNDVLTAGGTVSAPQDVILANANITGALTATAGNLTGGDISAASVAAGGSIAVGGATVPGAVTAGTSIVLGGVATLGDNVTAGNGITFGGAVTLNGAGVQTVHAGSGALVASASVNQTTDGGLNLRAGEIDFNGGAGSVTGTGPLSIQTTDASGSIGLGNLTVGDTPNRLNLTAADTAALGGAFSDIEIGDLANTREILIGAGATFGAPLTLRVDALGAANVAIQEELTGSLTAGELSINAVGQVLLGNATAGPVADTLQPVNQIARLGEISVNGHFYLFDSGAPTPYATEELGPDGDSPFFLDEGINNQRGLELAGDFTQAGTGVQTVIRTHGDLNILPGVAVQTGSGNVTVLSAEVPAGGSFLANFHNAGATGTDGVVVNGSTDGITVGANSQLLVFSSDANFNTFQRGEFVNLNSSAQNGVQPIGGQFHFGRIVTTDPPDAPPFGDPENFEAVFGQVITPNSFTFAPTLANVQFVVRSSTVPVPPEATKFVFFDFAPEPFAGITLDTQSFRAGIARPGTEIRTHSSLLYDFEEWNRKGRRAPAADPEPPAEDGDPDANR